MKASDLQNFTPWTAVWSGNSVWKCQYTCRIVFDASQQTPSETSLNDTLAKRKSNIDKRLQIVIHSAKKRNGFHTDINLQHNSVKPGRLVFPALSLAERFRQKQNTWKKDQ